MSRALPASALAARAGRAATHLALLATGALVAFPFFWMLLSALKTLPEAQTFPPVVLPAHPQWHNFVEALQAGGDARFTRFFMNSGLVACCTMAGVMFTALLAGYAFGALEFPGRAFLFGLYLATLMVP